MAFRRRQRNTAGAAIAALAVVSFGVGGFGARSGNAQTPPPPNVLLIVTDDQPVGTTKRMPNLSAAPGFARFTSYYDNNPLCCPSRATLLTGLYSHHTGVETNLVAERFDDSSTLATWLDGAGYETGLFGKYLNGYPWERGPQYVPAGWDRWSSFTPDASYYDYTLIEDGTRKQYGAGAAEYSTDVLADQVDEFIAAAEAPFFAYFAPYAPHAPRTPAPRHRNAFAGANVKLPPNFNRVARGAPRWWARKPRLDPAEAREATKGQWRSLLAVDDAIGRFLRTLEQQGEADNTVVIFLSDNGYSLGAHRNPWKDCAYEECIHVPLWVRWPGVTEDGNVDALVGNIDVAPTVAEIAGAQLPAGIDGESLAPLLRGEVSSLQRPILLRHVKYPRVAPSFWGLRTERFTYVEYGGGERELYDNETDPHQLRNLAGRPAQREVERDLRETLAAMRSD